MEVLLELDRIFGFDPCGNRCADRRFEAISYPDSKKSEVDRHVDFSFIDFSDLVKIMMSFAHIFYSPFAQIPDTPFPCRQNAICRPGPALRHRGASRPKRALGKPYASFLKPRLRF
jgi:hypothetical protein